MTKLSVNINKIATLRNARGGNNPNLIAVARDIIQFGAQGITVHPRPDERHIRKSDVYELKSLIDEINSEKNEKIEFNIEGYPSSDFLQLMDDIKPDQATLVPDPPDVITSNAGWDCVKSKELLQPTIKRLKDNSIRVSLFIDPFELNQDNLTAIEQLQPDRCELYTEAYAKSYPTKEKQMVTEAYKKAAERLHGLHIGLNAGHDLDQKNVKFLVQCIPNLAEVSIGHALICESLYDGLKKTIHNYLKEIQSGFTN
jgi:pyridoxine 5-phosphate synthase